MTGEIAPALPSQTRCSDESTFNRPLVSYACDSGLYDIGVVRSTWHPRWTDIFITGEAMTALDLIKQGWRYDHIKENGPYGVCRRCGREHDAKKDAAEIAAHAAIDRTHEQVIEALET